MDSDIRDLYASFDGAAETYREVHREEQCVEAARRWRLLGRIAATIAHPAAPPASFLQPAAPSAYQQAAVETGRSRMSFQQPADPHAQAIGSAHQAAKSAALARDATSTSSVVTPASAASGKTLKTLFQRLGASQSESSPQR